MINNGNDIGFIHDIANLDKLRQKAVDGDESSEKAALTAAAKQFEAIFTSMLFKSMREANSGFESDLMRNQNEQFYRQMMDEQMSSEMSASGSLGLADMIVAQLSQGSVKNQGAAAKADDFEAMMERVKQVRQERAERPEEVVASAPQTQRVDKPARFDTPENFISSLRPYAQRAARALGVDPSLLLAQAALETGWGQKVIHNARGSSNNLFNIKADRSWGGHKVATQTLEYHQGVPVKERAAFRSYANYQDSFDDYVRFLNDNPRYQTALRHGGDSEQFIRGIHKAGYATDPKYADKVLQVQQKIDQM
ncbi:flagellar assembly peptidoglycan hydrolase FlgJ [Vibrio sp. V39_P1S14PM300]|uniref:flagellar assembly peptidoglycan hydrolase FlgJ n=1 Tax=Vibrio sp. V39_P1S14PM300 TaxID=1938690 RepID=UPI0013729299|nr:flagellar assembly peptidoglycan hydrolase FlgJ [Vibrio sp. V39_P1S14PM300]NAX22841.1 flagellar assembly peptidoglycan hydrolase FlgJ [Vibrio sp. V39_P1S14PM300]